jgi:hypothetical protein
VQLHPKELAADWELAQALEPLVPIDPLPSITTMLRVTDVEPLNGYRLRVGFNDGVVREIDCTFPAARDAWRTAQGSGLLPAGQT